MQYQKLKKYIKGVLENMPSDWLNLTTHRLDIYNEALAKTEFISEFEKLYNANNADASALEKLPTAYDYIRLGHPLSSVFEWTLAKTHNIKSESVINFSSQSMPILAILRKNLLDNKNTLIAYTDSLPHNFKPELLKRVYDYNFEVRQVDNQETITDFNGSVIFISDKE